MEETDPGKRHDIIYYGLNEEVGELLPDRSRPEAEAHTALLWGQEVDPSVRNELSSRLQSEVGDVLYYLTASGMLQNVSLTTMIQSGLRAYTGRLDAECNTFAAFDAGLKDKMKPPVDADYSPDYFAMQFWNLIPLYYAASGEAVHKLEHATGPLLASGDGLFTLERTLRAASDWVTLEPSSLTPIFVEKAGLALGALSIVA